MTSLLAIERLTTTLDTPRGVVHAVDDVSLNVDAGETVSLIGESGSGKSTLALSILRLVSPRANPRSSGRVIFRGRDLMAMSEPELRKIRGRRIAVVFQDPMTSLNPVRTIGTQFVDVLDLHRSSPEAERRSEALKLLAHVGLPEPEVAFRSYPHQLSGGMLQRVLIAMAVAPGPDLIIADEPTSALDVTVQSQILDLLSRLQAERGLALVLVTHDIAVAGQVSDRILVMYAGRIVEAGSARSVLGDPRMPYTIALMNSVPTADASSQRLAQISGQPPSLMALPDGCAFEPRCGFSQPICRTDRPGLRRVGDDRLVACHFDIRAGDSGRSPHVPSMIVSD
jgi:oligopeptide/dipeptide ABC transporter ATP-binding protein